MHAKLTYSLVSVAAVAMLSGAVRANVDGPKTAKPAVVTVTAMDYAFQAPDTIAAGLTTIRLVNKGPDFHHVWLMKLDAGKRLTDLAEAMKTPGPLPKWATNVGGPNSPMPGGVALATLDLEPGTYVMACVIPAMKDGQPHFMKGMVKEVTVTPSRGGVVQAGQPLPAADVTMTLSDYDFSVSKPITAATRTIHVRNTAEQTHEVVFIKLNPGVTAKQFVEAAEKPQGPPPGMIVGGITGIAKGRTNDLTMTFTPGEYAMLCFVPDEKDGKSHLAHGMIKQFSVK
jgi:hypothetical protein